MPTVIQGANTSSVEYTNKDYKYKYPYKLDLHPGSKLHRKLLVKILESARASNDVMSRRHGDWREIDKTLTAYITTDEYEKALKKKSPNKPVSIVVPHSYAVMETILAYQTKAFLSSASPVFEYGGFSREDIISAKLLELVVDQQVRRLKSTLNIHTGFRNGLAYGLHASPVSWNTKMGRKPVIKDASTYSASGEILKQATTIENEPTILFEGNKVGAIDPYKYLPDPNVSPHMVQDGEFVGWIDEDSYMNLLADDRRGSLFNVKYLKVGNYASITSQFASDNARDKGKTTVKDSTGGTSPVTLINMYKTIIPTDYGLLGTQPGNEDGNGPEKWLFIVANDCIIICAAPLNLNHDMYPVAVNAPDYDGFSVAPISRLEMNAGLQSVLNWLFNSHIQNVRKAINDMFIVDPSLLNMNDIENPEPGKLLRLRRAAWGRGVDQAIKQLQVNDVTSQNIPFAASVMDLMSRSTGAVDALQGIMRSSGERRSATEFQGTFNSAISRLEHLSYITSQMYLTDLAYFHASHTQQLLSKETYVRAIGEWPAILLEEYGKDINNTAVSVSPQDILADFDIVFKDGSSASGEASGREFWTSTMDRISTNPELNQVFDIVRIFKKVARLYGEKDVNSFVRKGGSLNAKMIGDDAAAAEFEKGNLVQA